MKKIAVVTNGSLPVPASKGGASEKLLETFIEFNEKTNSYKLLVFTIYDDESYFLSKKYQNTAFVFIHSKTLLYKLARLFRFVVNKLKKYSVNNQFISEVAKYEDLINGADLILVINNPYYLPIIRKFTNKPLGLHLHNDYLNRDSRDFAEKILNGVDFVVCVSEYIKKRVREITSKDCKVDFVYNGIRLERFNNNNDRTRWLMFRNRYGITESEKVIVFCGRLQESKGIHLLLDVFLENSHKWNVKLLIVGSSGFASSGKTKFIKSLENKSKEVGDKVVFTGYIDNSEIHDIYKISDLAVFPSLAAEAFALTVVEALASGLPVIISDSGGMHEVVNEKCGIVVQRGVNMKMDLAKHIENLLNNDTLRNEMSIEAKLRASEFSDSNYYNSLSSFLDSV